MLSRGEAETLNNARFVLSAMEALADVQGRRTENLADAIAHARLSEAAARAEEAIFRVLNVADTYRGDPVAADAIKAYRSES